MPASPPQTAASALVGFAAEFAAALFLRPAIYDRAVRDAGTWRRAAVVVIVAAVAADSLGLYTDVDAFLVIVLANWSLLPIMLLAIARWAVAAGAAWVVCRVLRQTAAYGDLLRPSGYAYAPAAVQLLPAFVYWLDLMQVTPALLSTARWLAVPWLLAALTLAALAARVASVPRAITVAVVLFVSANLFDSVLDTLLHTILDLPGSIPGPRGGG